jgi:hypothetical protein
MFRYSRRRRLFTRRVLIVLGVVAVVGLVYVIVTGDSSKVHSAPAAAVSPAANNEGCLFIGDTEEGAAETAAAGLQALKQANLGPVSAHAVEVNQILERYVITDQAAAYLQVLQLYPSTFMSVATKPGVWETVSFNGTSAMIRMSTTDVATAADGSQRSGAAVIDATLVFDASASQHVWRLASWPTNHDPVVAAELAAHGHPFCASTPLRPPG